MRDELTRHLSEGWNSVVDREVDGKRSLPFQQNETNFRYGTVLASRRVSRIINAGRRAAWRTHRGVQRCTGVVAKQSCLSLQQSFGRPFLV